MRPREPRKTTATNTTEPTQNAAEPPYKVRTTLCYQNVFADADPTNTAVVGNDSRIMLRTGAGGVTHTSVQKYKIVIFKILRSVTVWYNIYINYYNMRAPKTLTKYNI